MQLFRLNSLQALQAGILGGGVAIDTVTSVSPLLHPAIVPNLNLILANTYTAPQVFANVSGIAPTTGTNTQTGVLNRNSGNAWMSFVATGGPASPQQGFMFTLQNADWLTVVPPTSTVLVQLTFTGMLQSGQGFKSGDLPDGTNTIAANDVRNGARVSVIIDQQAPIVYDTFNQNPVISVYLDGVSQHAIRVTHTGLFDSGVRVLTNQKSTVGTSFTAVTTVSKSLTQGQGAAASLLAAVWELRAASATTYTLWKTPSGGVQTQVGTTYNTNTLYDSTAIVPGIALQVTGSALTTGDRYTFQTDYTAINLEQVAFYTSSGSAAGQYITPILDSGDPGTQWFLYEHAEAFFPNGSSTVSLSIATSNTLHTSRVSLGHSSPLPPGSAVLPTVGPLPYLINANSDITTNGNAQTYSTLVAPQTLSLTPTGVTVPSTQERRNAAGLQAAATGRYAQFTFQLAVNTQGQTAWARDFRIYNWVPTQMGNSLLISRLGLPPNWRPGAIMQSYYGSLLTFVADLFSGIDDFTQSFGLSSAVDQYLLNAGNDLTTPHILGEPTSSYQTRLITSLQAKSLSSLVTSVGLSGQGTLQQPVATSTISTVTLTPVTGAQGSIQFICQQMAELVNGRTPVLAETIDSVTGLTTVTGGNITVAQLAGRGVSITLPNPPYDGLPNLAYGTSGGVDNPAKALIKAFAVKLMPASTLFDPNNSTYLNFNTLG